MIFLKFVVCVLLWLLVVVAASCCYSCNTAIPFDICWSVSLLGVMMGGSDLQAMVDFCSEEGNGGIIDEAYEFFHEVGTCTLP
jgi:hypothetical protein